MFVSVLNGKIIVFLLVRLVVSFYLPLLSVEILHLLNQFVRLHLHVFIVCFPFPTYKMFSGRRSECEGMPAPSQRYPRVAKYSFVLLSPLQAEEKAQKDEAASKVEDPHDRSMAN